MMRTSANKLIRGRKFLALFTLLILSLSLSGCGGDGGGFFLSMAISPTTATVATGASLPFSVSMSGSSDLTVTWSVNGVNGGDATHGTIDASGIYTAPGAVPTPATVTVTATSKAIPGLSASAMVTIVPLSLGSGTNYAGVFLNISGIMKDARSNHTATLLPTTITPTLLNGYTLVAGGIGSSGVAVNKAELFNPAARGFGHFTSVASMTKPRAYHAATRLQNGQVLVTGGIDNFNNPLASAEIYDPASRTFFATGSMATGRWMHTATLLSNGKVLIAGGNSDPGPGIEGGAALGSCELYDPATGRFTSLLQSMINPRYYHTATLLRNGKVLLAGGQGTGGQILPETELYDPAATSLAATFTASGSMMVNPAADTGRWQHTATVLNDVNGSVVMIGGNAGTEAGPGANHLFSAQAYDPLLATFTSSTSTINQLTDSRSHHTAALLATGNVLLAGGIGGTVSSLSDFLLSAELYNPAGSFAATGSMNFARANHTATVLPNGKIVVIGGNNGGVFLRSAELYQ